MSYLPFSRRWAGHLAAANGITGEKEQVLAYAIEVLVLTILNILGTLILGALLGVLPGTVTCLLIIAMFRQTAGGAHSNSALRCAVITVTTIPSIALLAGFLSRTFTQYADGLTAAAILIVLFVIVRKAPVDTEKAPIISPLRRKKLKLLSISAVALVTLAVTILRQTAWPHAGEVQYCVAVSLLSISVTLTGPGHRLMHFIDSIRIGKIKDIE